MQLASCVVVLLHGSRVAFHLAVWCQCHYISLCGLTARVAGSIASCFVALLHGVRVALHLPLWSYFKGCEWHCMWLCGLTLRVASAFRCQAVASAFFGHGECGATVLFAHRWPKQPEHLPVTARDWRQNIGKSCWRMLSPGNYLYMWEAGSATSVGMLSKSAGGSVAPVHHDLAHSAPTWVGECVKAP